MPQRDNYHQHIKTALIRAGWQITHDPYTIALEGDLAYVDLGAQQLFAAERDHTLIAVEVKGFTGPSVIADVEQALGQYALYRSWMARTDPQRTIYLAVSTIAAANVLIRPAIQMLITDYRMNIIVVDIANEEVREWRTAEPMPPRLSN